MRVLFFTLLISLCSSSCSTSLHRSENIRHKPISFGPIMDQSSLNYDYLNRGY